MRLHICAVGRLRAGPERDLLADYIQRADRTGRPLGLGPITGHEVEDKKGGGMATEADLLARVIPTGAMIVALDERGKSIGSEDFAKQVLRWRDDGRPAVSFVIGGADGIDPAFVTTADLILSFSPMVWPHQLVRIMLAEQLYRTTTILSGHPYHRGD